LQKRKPQRLVTKPSKDKEVTQEGKEGGEGKVPSSAKKGTKGPKARIISAKNKMAKGKSSKLSGKK